MKKTDALRETIAEFFQVDTTEVTAAFSLTGPRVSTSLGRYALDAAIRRRVGVRCKSIHTAMTFGDLLREVMGSTPDDVSSHALHTANGNRQANSVTIAEHASLKDSKTDCGIDLQLSDELPLADDYWEHEFYKTAFTPSEIAYCVAQDNPQLYFATRWCAKEALKKCDATFIHHDMNEIEVSHDEAGVPFLRVVDGEQLPVSLSLSHTVNLAAAIVVRQSDDLESAASGLPEESKEVLVATRDSETTCNRRLTTGSVAIVFSLVSLAIAVYLLTFRA